MRNVFGNRPTSVSRRASGQCTRTTGANIYFAVVALEITTTSTCIRSHLVSASGRCRIDGLRGLQSVLWRGRRETLPRVVHAGTFACLRPVGGVGTLVVAMSPLPFGRRSNDLAATQLRPANSQERQLHGRTQAREFGAGKLSKFDGLGAVATQGTIPSWIRLADRLHPTSRGTKKNPRR
jgi:hypothetical protein